MTNPTPITPKSPPPPYDTEGRIYLSKRKITAEPLVTIGEYTYYNDGYKRTEPIRDESAYLNGYYSEQKMSLVDTLMTIKHIKEQSNG